MKALLARLKQRKVIRVTGVYAVTGYGIFQIADNMLPALNLPAWTVTLTAVIFLLGFPVVVLLSYAFEWTARGLERTPPDGLAAGEASDIGWLNWLLLAATGAVLVAVAAFYIVTPVATTPDETPLAAAPDETPLAAAPDETPLAAAPDGTRLAAAPDGTRAVEGGAPDKSIAVLPFVNFSESSENEYFADGLTEELINGLAQLPELKVAGRTSSFYFKDRNEDLREIGRKLGVAHVLEGSVRRSGDNLRITAQLIQVSDGFHLWSETFDSRMNDAFVIQTQIARAVAQRLQARLLGGAGDGGSQRTARAYQLELVARSRLRKQELAELRAARDLYRELIAIEPDNAHAHAGLAEATISLAQSFLALEFDGARAESEAALEAALRLDPRSSEAWRVRGYVNRVLSLRTGEQRYADASLAAFQRAVELDSRNADALAQLAAQLLTAGQVEQAAATLRRSLEIDPLSRTAQQLLGTALDRQGRFGEARRQYESLIELYPDFTNARVALGGSLMMQGALDEAVATLSDPLLLRNDPVAALYLANCYANLDMPREMRVTLEGIVEPPIAAALGRFALLQRSGDLENTRELVEREIETTNEPIWQISRIMLAVRARDAAAAGAALAILSNDPLADTPSLDRSSAMDALLIAQALRLTGKTEDARRMVEALLRRFAAAPNEYVPSDSRLIRALAFGFLGRTDDSIAELTLATEQGYRTLIDFEYFLRPEDYPFMGDVTRDARYRALVATIETDNARMRENVLARAGR